MRTSLRMLFCLLILIPAYVLSESAEGLLKRGEEEGKTVYLYIHKDSASSPLQELFDKTAQRLGARVLATHLSVTDPQQRSIVERFGLKRAPMPLALVIAPNGCVTGGFLGAFTEEQLLGALQPLSAAQCLKALQERKLVLLCLQNQDTEGNQESLEGVREFAKDKRFAAATQVVMMDPQGVAEQSFIKQLGVEVNSSTAMTVMIVPPGRVVGQYSGAVSKERLVADLTKATSGCCCPGGCCPGGCCSSNR